MGYKSDLENANSIDECQQIYDDYVTKKYKQLSVSLGPDEAMSQMICKDYGYWQKAESRASEIAGYSSYELFVNPKF